jgi:hypothetical protein
MTRFSCHCSRVDRTPSYPKPLNLAAKNKAPGKGSVLAAKSFMFELYSTFLAKIKALWRRKTAILQKNYAIFADRLILGFPGGSRFPTGPI